MVFIGGCEMINVLNLDNEIVMQLTEADITKLLRVARAVTREDVRKIIDWNFPVAYDGDDLCFRLIELNKALKEVAHLL